MSAAPSKPHFEHPDSGLISVEEARARILSAIRAVEVEIVPIGQAHGRVAGADLAARLNHPPDPVSAMDGYALRAEDARTIPARLRKIGVSRAGERFKGQLTPGTCIRIFTGAVVPEGADMIALQEDSEESGDEVVIGEVPPRGRYIRKAGMDFSVGQLLVPAGRAITARPAGTRSWPTLKSIPALRM